jgi:hypothetical protein
MLFFCKVQFSRITKITLRTTLVMRRWQSECTEICQELDNASPKRLFAY